MRITIKIDEKSKENRDYKRVYANRGSYREIEEIRAEKKSRLIFKKFYTLPFLEWENKNVES